MASTTKRHSRRELLLRRARKAKWLKRTKGTPTRKFPGGVYQPPLTRTTIVARSGHVPHVGEKQRRKHENQRAKV
jgi:hypothetical protein